MLSSARRRAIGTTLTLLVGSALSIAALFLTRPHLTGSPSSWKSDEVAIGTAWIVAIACASWLALTTVACLGALARGRTTTAIRIAAFAPPILRRVLQAALVTSTVLLPSAAYAAAPPAPLVLHLGAGGRLTTVSEAAPNEVPVVRAPPVTHTPTSTTTGASSSTTAPEPTRTTIAHQQPLTTAPVARPAPVPTTETARPTAERTYVVRAGDNLWRIAGAHVGRAASDETIARYWQRMIAANRTTLRSGDPSLIFPGEVIALPLD